MEAYKRKFSGDTVIKIEKQLERLRRRIVSADKQRRRLLKSIELAIEQISTSATTAELAEWHHLTKQNERRYIENAILLAQQRMYEKSSSNTKKMSNNTLG